MSWHVPVVEKLSRGETVRVRARRGVVSPPVDPRKTLVLVPVLPAAPKSGSVRERAQVGDVVLCEVRGMHWIHPIGAIRSVNGRQLYQITTHRGEVRGWVSLASLKGKLHSIE